MCNATDAGPTWDPWSTLFEQSLDNIRKIHYAKRNDYTGGKDPLENYRRSAEVIGVTPEQIMLARVQEKVTRLGNLLKPGFQKQVDETVEDALLDVANIALLILTLRRSTGANTAQYFPPGVQTPGHPDFLGGETK